MLKLRGLALILLTGLGIALLLWGCSSTGPRVKHIPGGGPVTYTAGDTGPAAVPQDWLPKAKGEPNENGIHDPTVELKGFPKDKIGNIDWVLALDKGLFTPRGSLDARVRETIPLDFNVLRIPAGTMPDVIYPHRQHTQILDCSNCHPKIFVMAAGANPITMTRIVEGEYCGRCHGKVSFPLTDCFRCHSQPK